MFQRSEILLPDEKQRMVDALQEMRRSIRWKSGKDIIHLEKRRKMKHLPPSTSLQDYEKIISDIVRNGHKKPRTNRIFVRRY